MKYLEVVADAGNADTVSAFAEKHEVADLRIGTIGEDGRQAMRILVSDDKMQSVLDSLQTLFGAQSNVRIIVLPVEITLPKPSEVERKEEDSAISSREALYESVEKNARLDLNFVVLVFLSTVVATIGLIENNVAVVIGAMVIAPLLGPNLAFGLGTALGDTDLMRQSLVTTVRGIVFAIALSVGVAMIWPVDISSSEITSRTQVGLDSVALALASGAAAALSLTTGLSSVLVGVMVAVALLPPAVTLGLMLGNGNGKLALGAGLLLAINLVCVNLACKLVFMIKGIRPRTWVEKERAQRAMIVYILSWVVTLIVLVLIVYSRQPSSSSALIRMERQI